MNGLLLLEARSGRLLFFREFAPRFGLPEPLDGADEGEESSDAEPAAAPRPQCARGDAALQAMQLASFVFAMQTNAGDVAGVEEGPQLRAVDTGASCVSVAAHGGVLAAVLASRRLGRANGAALADRVARGFADTCAEELLLPSSSMKRFRKFKPALWALCDEFADDLVERLVCALAPERPADAPPVPADDAAARPAWLHLFHCVAPSSPATERKRAKVPTRFRFRPRSPRWWRKRETWEPAGDLESRVYSLRRAGVAEHGAPTAPAAAQVLAWASRLLPGDSCGALTLELCMAPPTSWVTARRLGDFALVYAGRGASEGIGERAHGALQECHEWLEFCERHLRRAPAEEMK